MDYLQTVLKHEIRNTKFERSPNARRTRKLETKRRFEHFYPFRISSLFRVASFEFRISRIGRWLLALVATAITGVVLYFAFFVALFWSLRATNLW